MQNHAMAYVGTLAYKQDDPSGSVLDPYAVEMGTYLARDARSVSFQGRAGAAFSRAHKPSSGLGAPGQPGRSLGKLCVLAPGRAEVFLALAING